MAFIISSVGGQHPSMNTTILFHRLCVVGGLSLVLLAGCDPKDSSLGDLPESATGMASEDMSGSDSYSTGSSEASLVGAPCEVSEPIEAALLEYDQSGSCGGGYCLFADVVSPSIRTCDSADGCSSDEGDEKFYCDLEAGRCKLDPDFVAERSMCSQNCETADDCIGADGTACEGGFSCEPIASLGELCCQNVCVCNDNLDTAAADDLRYSCENGLLPHCT